MQPCVAGVGGHTQCICVHVCVPACVWVCKCLSWGGLHGTVGVSQVLSQPVPQTLPFSIIRAWRPGCTPILGPLGFIVLPVSLTASPQASMGK